MPENDPESIEIVVWDVAAILCMVVAAAGDDRQGNGRLGLAITTPRKYRRCAASHCLRTISDCNIIIIIVILRLPACCQLDDLMTAKPLYFLGECLECHTIRTWRDVSRNTMSRVIPSTCVLKMTTSKSAG